MKTGMNENGMIANRKHFIYDSILFMTSYVRISMLRVSIILYTLCVALQAVPVTGRKVI